MNRVVPIQADPDLVEEVRRAVYERVRPLRAVRGGPVEVTIREATILTAVMNDMNAGTDRGLAFEPEVGDEGTVFGHPFVVVAETRHADIEGA